ncbi:MAG: PilT/PilU family type 4a pilus ATPase [bacterium]|nr:PilT/PilU family type 4a pilus ATPase [bacterium]
MPTDFDTLTFLKRAIKFGASDIHLKVDEHPTIRKDGKIIKIDLPKITDADMDTICSTLVPKEIKTKANSVFDLDFAFEIKNLSRFRVNLSRQLGKTGVVIRAIPYEIKSPDELNLPEIVNSFTELNTGIVFVTGATGCGKTTTLASIIEHINQNYQKHIITIEDPIEFIFTGKKSIITQRQIEIDTPSTADGIKYALRQDPDVILIGEIRDRETMSNALKAAETGHLVFATLHTNDAIQTITRVINLYEPNDREFIRTQIAETLRGTIAQKLVLTKDGTRHPACEVLIATPTIKDFIIKDKLEEIYELVKKGSFDGMETMNMSLFNLLQAEIITEEEALNNSNNKIELQQMLKGIYHGTERYE